MARDVPRADVRIALADCFYDCRQMQILLVRIWRFIFALELDADRVVVAFAAATKTGLPGMPCATLERHELNQLAIAANHEVR